MNNVYVLLSTYNGERYIREQIESILSQEGVDVTLFVRDDSSNDNTLSILNELKSKYTNIIVSTGKNLGAALSFMELLFHVPDTSLYYAFADQDDIWEPNKLATAIRMLESNQNAVLYSSNQKVVDKDNHYIGNRYSFSPPLDVFNIIDKNYLSGCTMVMKRELLIKVRKIKPSDTIIRNRMHDTWMAAVAACVGGIVYDENSYIRYRQHDNNVVGVKSISLKKRIISKIKEKNSYHKDFADELLKLFKSCNENVDDYSLLALQYYHNANTLSGKFKLLTSSIFSNNYFRNKIQFGLKLLFFE